MLDIKILFLKRSSGKSRDVYYRQNPSSGWPEEFNSLTPGLMTLALSSQCWTESSLVGTGWRTCFALFSSVKGI